MIVQTDAKSLEWVTYLYLSQDKTGIDEWMEVVKDPKTNDMHTANQLAFALPSRLIAKVFLFRWIYRGSAFAYSKDPDFADVSKSVDFWQDVIDRYYRKYQSIEKTHIEYIKTATTTGRLVSPFGREYVFKPFTTKTGDVKWNESDIVNWPNQGLGSDVMAVARVMARNRFSRYRFKSLLISTVHDSLIADCIGSEVDNVAEVFRDVFRDLPKNIEKAYQIPWKLPMLGEVSIGPNMADLKEITI